MTGLAGRWDTAIFGMAGGVSGGGNSTQ